MTPEEFESEFEQIVDIVDLVGRRNAWAAQVFKRGIDAPPYPLTVEEDRRLLEYKTKTQAFLRPGWISQRGPRGGER
jgi:hypothetical protein